ncbi:putative colanic acid biosynthesis acetyltransferase [Klebsiella quasipneumoniae]|uniref:Putative acetyltransferase n=1 Tax=Klebsiella pneumoniae TaxID=573 RepID=X2GW97_KLEPN|nr:putative acetyltransferase [Klebsiella pneumoniae]HBQ8785579.1 colanic acid biosynthesis acetyltransferase WcaF [Klebsiella quasipneumoniae]
MYELKNFKVPKKFRGKNVIYTQLWWLVQSTLFAWSPQVLYKWRVFLLRMFGASIGKNVIIRPSAKITYPWKVKIGDYSWIGDDVTLYSLGNINVGNNTVISQRCYLCAGSHDYNSINFDIISEEIIIGDSCWLATDVFVAPGINIGTNCVVGARSSVFKNLPSNSICLGSPATKIRDK